jgi:signal transduction histidine kinase
MGTKSVWAAAGVPLALIVAVGTSFVFVAPFDHFHRLLPIGMLLAVMGLSWYGGRRIGVVASLLGVVALWTAHLAAPFAAGDAAAAAAAALPEFSAVTLAESLSLVLTALLTGGLRDARDRAEGALLERDARLGLVSAQLPAILWSTDTQLNLTTSMGTGGLATFAHDGSEHPTAASVGTFLEFLNPSDPTSQTHPVHLEALRGIACTFEIHWRERSFQSHLEPLRNPDGDLIGVIGVAVEITERKKAEGHLQAAKELAETATHAKDRFLAMLSHELRTPLTPALAAASALQRDPYLPDDVRDDIEMIRRNIELEVRLIDDLLDLTRISKGKLQFRFEPEDVHGLLRGAIDICREEVTAKGLTLRTDFRARSHHVGADGARLRQVFWNLLKNSVKFTPAGGEITIHTSDGEGGCLAVDVTDTGVGIDSTVLPHVFDAFEQGGADVTRSFGGLGLGLAISKALVEAHHGQLKACSAGRLRGATFRVELPTVPAPATTFEERPVQDDLEEAAAAQPGRRLEILLVEDHCDTARVLKRLLNGSGHHVRTADTVRSALAAAAAERVDLVVSDLGLPDGTGFELMQQLMQQHALKGIALSGFGTDQDVARSREAGFAYHLTKPIDFRRLEEAIELVAS